MTIKQERITKEEYINFLKRTDLGSQYPKERFIERIEKLVNNVQISVVCKNEEEQIIGVCFGITDFAYWLFITDLGVDRDYLKQGIGTKLLNYAHELAGGKDNIVMYLCANDSAINFYEKAGMKKTSEVMERNEIEWTSFKVE